MGQIRRKALALGGAFALTLGIAGSAHAAAYQWQDYTRDSSWNCGPAGTTQYVENLYLLACVKVSYGDWQVILIATATSLAGYLWDYQVEWNVTSGTAVKIDEGECNAVDLDPSEIGPGESRACFSPTHYNPNSQVDGTFTVTVTSDPAGDDPHTIRLWTPDVWTTS